MTGKDLLSKIVSDISDNSLFTDFKLRKRDNCLFYQKNGFRKEITFEHWFDKYTGELVIYPIYGIKYDILLNWFSKYNFKSKQDQKDNYSFGFEGVMFGLKSSHYHFDLSCNNYPSDFANFQKEVLACANWVFTNYATLSLAYNNEVEPVLLNKKELPDIGIEWAFIDLTLCKIVAPQNYEEFKKIVLARIEFLHKMDEPNLAFYYDKLSEILSYMEGLSIENLSKL
jgi:hypothetical protein